jgi:hypothetical protein
MRVATCSLRSLHEGGRDMMKRAILLAAVACVAMFALPAVASATVWHLDKAVSFSGSGGSWTFSGAGVVDCTSHTIEGAYESTTTGWVTYTFHGCTLTTFTFPPCTTSGESAGTIKTTKLAFHNVVLGGKPGILLTPNHATNTFAHFTCFGIPITIHGNGLLGTTNRNCGDTAASWMFDFNTIIGAQEHTVSTGVTYGLTSTSGGGSSTPSTFDTSGTTTFAGGESRTFICT